MSLEKLLSFRQGFDKPLLCLEVNPPKGVNLSPIFERLDGSVENIDFFNVTDSALARMRLAALPFAGLLKERYKIEPLVNFSCRDRNSIATQGDLLAGWLAGVRSIVALTGDAVAIGDLPDCKGVFERNSLGLLNVISTLNSGKDLAGKDLNGAPGYIPGCVVNPNVKNPAAEVKRLFKKREAGARYALSQPVFCPNMAYDFLNLAKQEVGMPIFLGLLPFKSAEQAKALSNVPGIKIPSEIVDRLSGKKESEVIKESFDLCREIVNKNSALVCGFHIVSGTTPKLALDLCKEIARIIKI